MKLVTVIVNYNTGTLAWKAALSALADTTTWPESPVLIVDNCSTDTSWQDLQGLHDALQQSAPEQAQNIILIQADANSGFGAGCNVGIRWAQSQATPPKYIYFLNPDAIAKENAIVSLVECLDAHPEAGIAGGCVTEDDAGIWTPAFRFPTALSEFESNVRLGAVSKLLAKHRVHRSIEHSEAVDWVGGYSFLTRTKVFDEVGLFDEDFFLYYEETDLCRRAQKAGWRIWAVTESLVDHIGGASTGVWERKRRPAYWFEARSLYFRKNHGRLYLAWANICWLCGYGIWLIKQSLRPKQHDDPPLFMWDFLRHLMGRYSWSKSHPKQDQKAPTQ